LYESSVVSFNSKTPIIEWLRREHFMSEVDDLYREGEQLKDEGQDQEAIAKFQQVLDLDESYALAHFALAVMYGKAGKHEEAIKHGERACELDPSDPFSFTAMSVTYQRAFAGTQNPQYIQMAESAMARAHALQMGQ
jgi:tetratricopeptide (TPR) repeat protein